MKPNEAISKRLDELLTERGMTQYQLFMKSGVPKSTIGNVINCSYDSVKLRIIHEMCQGELLRNTLSGLCTEGTVLCLHGRKEQFLRSGTALRMVRRL